MPKNYASLNDVLGLDTDKLTHLEESEFETKKLGLIPFTEIEPGEYADMKKECYKTKVSGGRKNQNVEMDFDDEKLKVMLIINAVDKDKRSDFTFANGALIQKLSKKDPNVVTAVDAVRKLLSIGEINNWAIDIQEISGIGEEAKEEVVETIKN